MLRPLIALAVVAVPALAHADGNLEVGASGLVASESSDVRSAGHPGIAVTGVSWDGAIGVMVEAGHQPWAWDSSANYFAIGGRISPASSPRRICDRRTCMSLRPWLELGISREQWMIEEPGIPHTAFGRNAGRGALGLDALVGNTVGGSIWFRVQHATDRPTIMGPYGEAREPYDTSLVVGLGVFFAAM